MNVYVSDNKLAHISRESSNKATITWSPTTKEQSMFTEFGVKGQFIIQYDVDHKSSPNQVLVSCFKIDSNIYFSFSININFFRCTFIHL